MKMNIVEGFSAIGDALGDIPVPTDVDVDVETTPVDSD